MTTNRKRPTASRMVMYLMTSYVSLKSQGHDPNSQYTENSIGNTCQYQYNIAILTTLIPIYLGPNILKTAGDAI